MSTSNQNGGQKTDTKTPGVPPPAAAQMDEPRLIAYRTAKWPRLRIVPAAVSRRWMLETTGQFAQRCLPLLLANQAGWLILNSHSFCATWDGGDDLSSVRVEDLRGPGPYPVSSHFGHGILTWTIPFLFRTPRDYNLLIRGPANYPKDGIYALEGLVETDWAMATFTMNWKFTRPNFSISFEADEPICMILPQRRGELESFKTQMRDIEEEPEIDDEHRQWAMSRRLFLNELYEPDSEAVKQSWQKHYFHGCTTNGSSSSNAHQLKLRLQSFDEPWTHRTMR